MKSTIAAILALTVLTGLVSSCARPYTKELGPAAFNQSISKPTVAKLAIRFEESVPGKPFNETVWDNVSGPFWDPEESRRIGFTQNYKPQFFAIPPVLLPAVAQAGGGLVDTRILVPFGNLLSSMTAAAAKKSFSASWLCFDEACLEAAQATDVLSVRIDSFLVWESPLNHINLYAKGRSIHRRGREVRKDYAFEKSLAQQKLGSIMSTGNAFLNEMSRISNQFCEELAREILENGL